jgi:hypothetical protein
MAQSIPVTAIHVSKIVQGIITKILKSVWAWQKLCVEVELCFELANHLGAKDVLHHIGIAIYVAGRNVGVTD